MEFSIKLTITPSVNCILHLKHTQNVFSAAVETVPFARFLLNLGSCLTSSRFGPTLFSPFGIPGSSLPQPYLEVSGRDGTLWPFTCQSTCPTTEQR